MHGALLTLIARGAARRRRWMPGRAAADRRLGGGQPRRRDDRADDCATPVTTGQEVRLNVAGSNVAGPTDRRRRPCRRVRQCRCRADGRRRTGRAAGQGLARRAAHQPAGRGRRAGLRRCGSPGRRSLGGADVRRVALGNPQSVPAGVYARQWLERAGSSAAVSPKKWCRRSRCEPRWPRCVRVEWMRANSSRPTRELAADVVVALPRPSAADVPPIPSTRRRWCVGPRESRGRFASWQFPRPP